MARLTNIQLRRSANAGAVPTTSNLDLGELALNTYDGKLYMKKSVSGTDTVVEIGAQGVIASDILKDFRYVATATQTSFSGSDTNSNTLDYIPNALSVFLNGIHLDPNQDFTAVNGNTVVLSAGAAVGDIVQIKAFYRTVGSGSNTVQTFTGDGSTYAFTLSVDPENENQTLIYINGVYKNKSSYAISGTTLDFGSGNAPANGVAIEVITHTNNLTATNIVDFSISGDFTSNTITSSGTITGNLTGNVTGNTSGSAGTVTSLSGRTTSDLTEGSNLYYTVARFNSALSSANTGSLAEGSNLYYTNARFDTRLASKTTANLTEGANLYYTAARFNSAFTAKSTSDLSEGSNLYYTDARFDTRLATKSTTNLSEGTNLYYTAARFNSALTAKSTSDLSEGTNLYYTDARARAAITVTDAGGDGSLSISSGVLTYTGPSASEVRAHFSAGSNITISGSGVIAGSAAYSNSDVQTYLSSGNATTITTTGTVIVGGDLTVNGTTTTINTANLAVADLNIVVGKNATTSAATTGAGLTFGAWSSGTIPTFTWDHANTRFAMNKSLAANIVGNVTGNADTATTLATARTISGVSFNGSANITLNTSAITENANLYYTNARADARIAAASTSDLSEGSNLYFTNERVDDRAAALITAGTNITVSYDDAAGTLTINSSGKTQEEIEDIVDGLLTAGTGIGLTYNDSAGTLTVTNTAVGANAFGNIAVSGQTTLAADSTNDTLTVVGGTGITITTAVGTDTLTITNSAVGANAFGNIVVAGQTTVAADSTNDTLTIVAGAGMSITTDASSDTITIAGAAGTNPLGTTLHTATNAQTVFAIGQTPQNEDSMMVFVEGVYQNKNSYTISGSNLTFSSGIQTGDEVVIHSVANGINGTGHNTDLYTANGVLYQFVLSVDPQSENNCFVFWDGVYQEKSNFTTNGTTINFGSSNVPPNGTKIEVITPTVTAVNVPTTGSVVPNSMSTGGPSWDSAGAVTISESVQNTVTTNITNTTATTILSLPSATFRSAKAEISISDSTSSDYEFVEVGMVHNGTTTSSTVYGQVYTGAAENGTITSTFSSGNMILQFTSANTNTLAIKVKYSALKV